MQERFEMFTVLINRISRDIRRIKNQEMAEMCIRDRPVCGHGRGRHGGACAGGAV